MWGTKVQRYLPRPSLHRFTVTFSVHSRSTATRSEFTAGSRPAAQLVAWRRPSHRKRGPRCPHVDRVLAARVHQHLRRREQLHGVAQRRAHANLAKKSEGLLLDGDALDLRADGQNL